MSLRMIRDVLANRRIATHCPLCGRSFGRIRSGEEHIFPGWLQHHHNLWNRRLTIPNFIGKSYKGVKIRICFTCNNLRYGRGETVLAKLVRAANPYAECAAVVDDKLAIWLGKSHGCCAARAIRWRILGLGTNPRKNGSFLRS